VPGTTATPNILTDAGYLFWAPLGSAEPANTVSGSKFTDNWPVAWLSLGATEDGSEFDYNIKVDPITVAEFYDVIAWRTTERTGSFAFNMANWALQTLSQAMNGGTRTVVSGTGTTQLNSFLPPAPGAEVRAMIGWEALDNTARLICYQCINSGTIKSSFKKAPAIASIACQFNFEVPSSGNPFKFYTAGTARA
jgi:hypothetical protein